MPSSIIIIKIICSIISAAIVSQVGCDLWRHTYDTYKTSSGSDSQSRAGASRGGTQPVVV